MEGVRFVALLVVAAGCGRIGLDPIANLGGDAAPDARVCPSDTAAITTTAVTDAALVCIEKTERGTETWTTANATCASLGRRLCTDAEWAAACENTVGLVDMAGDPGGQNWEWVADILPSGDGGKRGYDLCSDTSSHEILVDPYDFRCCVDI